MTQIPEESYLAESNKRINVSPSNPAVLLVGESGGGLTRRCVGNQENRSPHKGSHLLLRTTPDPLRRRPPGDSKSKASEWNETPNGSWGKRPGRRYIRVIWIQHNSLEFSYAPQKKAIKKESLPKRQVWSGFCSKDYGLSVMF